MSLKKWLCVLLAEVVFFGSVEYFRLDDTAVGRYFLERHRMLTLGIFLGLFLVLLYLGAKTIYDENHPQKPG